MAYPSTTHLFEASHLFDLTELLRHIHSDINPAVEAVAASSAADMMPTCAPPSGRWRRRSAPPARAAAPPGGESPALSASASPRRHAAPRGRTRPRQSARSMASVPLACATAGRRARSERGLASGESGRAGTRYGARLRAAIRAGGTVRVRPRRGRRHDALAFAREQGLEPLASVRVDPQGTPGRGRARAPLDAQIAVVASPARGRLTDEGLQQRAGAIRCDQRQDARVGVRIVAIQHLQPRPRAGGEGGPAHATGDEAEPRGVQSRQPAPHLVRGGGRMSVALPGNQCPPFRPGVISMSIYIVIL
jgi:hypothetical protein